MKSKPRLRVVELVETRQVSMPAFHMAARADRGWSRASPSRPCCRAACRWVCGPRFSSSRRRARPARRHRFPGRAGWAPGYPVLLAENFHDAVLQAEVVIGEYRPLDLRLQATHAGFLMVSPAFPADVEQQGDVGHARGLGNLQVRHRDLAAAPLAEPGRQRGGWLRCLPPGVWVVVLPRDLLVTASTIGEY